MSNFLDERGMFNPDNADRENSKEDLPQQKQTLRECVSSSLAEYMDKVEHEDISNLYDLVLSEVEAPLLATVMHHARSNQSKAAAMLGLNRGTLRKKLKKYGMLN